MSQRSTYPPGAPCWVTVLQADASAARDFYGPLFGWEFLGPGGSDAMPYFVATLDGAEVAGIGSLPEGVQPAWMTEVRVEDADAVGRRAAAAGGTVLAGPMELPPVGRLTVLADPVGAVVCAIEPDAREGAQRVNEPGAWGMSALQAPDAAAVTPFYAEVFGWQPEPFGPATMWRLPGYVGGEPQQPVPRDVVAAMVPATAGKPPAWGVDFWVHDADTAAATAAQLGGQVLVEPHDDPVIGFRNAVLADPEGAPFSVSQLLS